MEGSEVSFGFSPDDREELDRMRGVQVVLFDRLKRIEELVEGLVMMQNDQKVLMDRLEKKVTWLSKLVD